MNTPVHSIDFYHAGKLARWSRILPLATVIGANLLFSSVGYSQAFQTAPAAAPALTSAQRSGATITYSDGSSLSVRTRGPRLPLVSANARQTMNIQMRFPASAAGMKVDAQALDGGAVAIQPNASVGTDGSTVIQFKPAAQPGLYRLLVRAGSATSTLQFWVPDLQNPSANPPALKP